AFPGGTDGFVAKLNTNGQYEWAKQIKCTPSSILNYLTLDKVGNIFVAGTFRGLADFGNNITLQSQATQTNNWDWFIARLDMQGDFQQATSIWHNTSNANNANIRDIATDNEGAVYIGGQYYGTLNYGDTTLTSQESDAYISKLIPQEDSISVAWILGSKDGAAVTQSLYASSSRE